MLRRIGVLASLAVFATMFAGISTAQAQSAGVCVFEGLAGNLTPPLPAGSTDTIDFEQGTYDYGGPARCAGKFGDDVITPTGAGPNVRIDSDGYYDNMVCGTGFAHDTDGSNTVVQQTAGGSATVDNVGYEIPFTNGQGPLLIAQGTTLAAQAGAPNHPEAGSDSSASHGPTTGDFQGEGDVQIVPNDGDCVTTPVGEFLVNGSFVAHGQ